jgi:hypothetical protein
VAGSAALRRRLLDRPGEWEAAVAAGFSYLAVMAAVALLLPSFEASY